MITNCNCWKFANYCKKQTFYSVDSKFGANRRRRRFWYKKPCLLNKTKQIKPKKRVFFRAECFCCWMEGRKEGGRASLYCGIPFFHFPFFPLMHITRSKEIVNKITEKSDIEVFSESLKGVFQQMFTEWRCTFHLDCTGRRERNTFRLLFHIFCSIIVDIRWL